MKVCFNIVISKITVYILIIFGNVWYYFFKYI